MKGITTFKHKRNLVVARKLTSIIMAPIIVVAWLIGASAFMDAMGAWRFDLKVIAFLLYVMHTIGVGVAVKLFVELVDWVRGVAYRKSKIRR